MILAVLIATVNATDASNSNWGYWESAPLRYAPTLAAFAAAVCLLLGSKGVPLGAQVLAIGGFSAACLAGGIYTVHTQGAGLVDTFIGRGLCVLPFLPAYIVCLLPKERSHFGRTTAAIILTATICMIPVLVAWRLGVRFVDKPHIYHITAVYFCSAAGFLIANPRGIIRRTGAVIMATAAVLTIKLTGFGFATIIAAFLWGAETTLRGRSTIAHVTSRRIAATILLTSALGVAATIGTLYREHMPDGTKVVRIQTYTARLNQFLADPIAGSLFTGSPIMQIGHNAIPSHSDLLDILAFGGIIGAALFYVPAAAAVLHGLRRMGQSVVAADGFTLFATITAIAFLWESAANPILGDPRFITLYWIAIGALLADRVVVGRQTIFLRSEASHLGAPGSSSRVGAARPVTSERR